MFPKPTLAFAQIIALAPDADCEDRQAFPLQPVDGRFADLQLSA
jgi:hypothetical protein